MSDRSWMWMRLANKKCVRSDFKEKLNNFLDYAYAHESCVDRGKIKCPCTSCKNRMFKLRAQVYIDIIKNGFMRGYDRWTAHGEPRESQMIDEPSTETMTQKNIGMERMVMDFVGPEFDWNARHEEQRPNRDAKSFFDLLNAAEQPLFEGCETYTKLSAMCEMFNIKSEFNMPEACYDRLAAMMQKVLPKGNLLPKNFYKTKRELAKLGLKYERIDACKNNCMLYYKENKYLQSCSVCQHPRYKPSKPRSRKKVPHKVLHYLPLTPRLKRLYMSVHSAKEMTWHTKAHEEGTMGHPAHGEAWKNFDKCNPSFAAEPRNVRLGLCTDGFTPFNNFGTAYSCWPVIVTVYNLPPGMCMQEPYMFLSLVIPGPLGPGKSLDVFLRPLIDELNMLWTEGVQTYDVSKKENFQMRAGLLWTISDFPAYGMLSGWSTHGKLACPYCMNRTKSFYLTHGRKSTWFDCHRQFLPANHRYRRDTRRFRRGVKVKDPPPPRLSSEEVCGQVYMLPDITFGTESGKQKIDGFGQEHNWVKKSIFWELPYWQNNLIRHNLDVMHIEKNVFENIFNIIMDIKNKSKDNARARQDVEKYCDRPELNLVYDDKKKPWKPKAPYTLTKEQIESVCSWVRELKFPDGYVSNIAGRVNEKGHFYGMKSHDCHVFMQRLLPIAFNALPKPIWETLTDLSQFFKNICSTIIREKDMEQLEVNIVEILCNLEKIFPPGFFDSMEHLPLHLPYEAKVGGPVQYRWMYPFERFLRGLKKKVTNKNKVEASIVNAYLNEEVSRFCTLYFEPTVETRFNRIPRNDDGGPIDSQGSLSIFTYPGRPLGPPLEHRRLNDDEILIAHRYVLTNCQELCPFIEKFSEAMKEENPNILDDELDRLRDANFPKWFQNYVNESSNDLSPELVARIRCLTYPPSRTVKLYKGYFINGFKFHTTDYGKHRTTSNNGICVLGSSSLEENTDYYGLVDEIMELDYFGNKVVVFKCRWFDTSQRGTRLVHPHFKLIEVNIKSRLRSSDHFVLAEQASQVCYTNYPKGGQRRDRGEWVAVCKIKARNRITMPLLDQEEEVEEKVDDPLQEQEISTPGQIHFEGLADVDVQCDSNLTLEEVNPEELWQVVDDGVNDEDHEHKNELDDVFSKEYIDTDEEEEEDDEYITDDEINND